MNTWLIYVVLLLIGLNILLKPIRKLLSIINMMLIILILLLKISPVTITNYLIRNIIK